MGMSQSYGIANDIDGLSTIHRALELGIDFLDTADMYGPFTNEVLVGKAIANRRDEVVLATKFGNERRPDGTFVGVNGRPEYVRSCIDASLSRLGVEYVDLYYQHRVDPDVAVEETWGAMGELVSMGKVKYLGISEAAPATIRKAHATHPMSAIQSEYSLFTRDPENGVLDVAQELGIGFVPYSPLGRGILTGTITSSDDFEADDFRLEAPRFQGENLKKNLSVVEKISQLAERKGVTNAQLALAWVLSRGEYIVPIPGTKRIKYLEDNVAALYIQLEEEDIAALEEIAPPGIAVGDRYRAEHMKRINI